MLWLAIVIYSAGLGLILYTRPSLMFMESGAWKEFGYQRGPRYTVFPFWLFAIVWAIVSYSLSAAITVGFGTYSSGISTMTVASAASRVGTGWGDSWASADDEAEAAEEEAEEEAEEAEAMMPPKRRRGRPRKLNMFPVSEESNTRTATATTAASGKPRSGYYVLEEPASNTGGLRRYVYYGDNPPSVSTQ
uniref:Uncharacterized protein n=1 Tax=viral metagenome TaxID=1070528 RepID=A0A6C0DCC9_9ZZZZ